MLNDSLFQRTNANSNLYSALKKFHIHCQIVYIVFLIQTLVKNDKNVCSIIQINLWNNLIISWPFKNTKCPSHRYLQRIQKRLPKLTSRQCQPDVSHQRLATAARQKQKFGVVLVLVVEYKFMLPLYFMLQTLNLDNKLLGCLNLIKILTRFSKSCIYIIPHIIIQNNFGIIIMSLWFDFD